mgnify:CR=1 FL=1
MFTRFGLHRHLALLPRAIAGEKGVQRLHHTLGRGGHQLVETHPLARGELSHQPRGLFTALVERAIRNSSKRQAS